MSNLSRTMRLRHLNWNTRYSYIKLNEPQKRVLGCQDRWVAHFTFPGLGAGVTAAAMATFYFYVSYINSLMNCFKIQHQNL